MIIKTFVLPNNVTILWTSLPSNSDQHSILQYFSLFQCLNKLTLLTDTGKLYGKLLGIVTMRDIQFHKSLNDPVTSVMTPYEDLLTAPQNITFEEANAILRKSKKGKLPIVDAQGHLTSLLSRSDLMKNLHYPLASKMPHSKQLICAAAVGTREDDKVRVRKLVEAGLDIVVLDSSQGNSVYQIEMIKWIKKEFEELEIIAGNVVTRYIPTISGMVLSGVASKLRI